MLPVYLSPVSEWRQVLRKNFTHWEKLADFLELTDELRKQVLPWSKFSLNLPVRLAEKIEKGTLKDPILRQFVPLQEELIQDAAYRSDPVGDQTCRKAAKLLHKYQGRVLIVTTSACAMHCRYCFRQNFDYEVQAKGFEEELHFIAQDPSICEVILSGGDPLSLSDETLGELLFSLEKIPHVRKIRFHTRFPIGIPERIDQNFLSLLNACSKQLVFVVHVNHPKELDEEVLARLKLLRLQGVLLLNQSVLLRGVNDELHVLKDLSEMLVDHGILPYYLHQLDKVQGASHFEVPEEIGKKLISQLASLLPGYAVPKYVKEIPGEESKTSL